MRPLLLLLLLSPVLLFSQRKVSEVCASYKQACDSALRVEYGDVLFPYIVLDTNSYVWTDGNHAYSWNEVMPGDSVYKYEFSWSFQFPGARCDEGVRYGPLTDRWGRLLPDLIPHPGRCSYILPENKMDSIARKHLHKPLAKCQMNLHHEAWYFKSDEDGPYDLDSTHLYFEINDHTWRGSGKRGTKFKSIDRIIIVDACTGEVVCPPVKTVYKGVSGRF